jgi:hypothetical protein
LNGHFTDAPKPDILDGVERLDEEEVWVDTNDDKDEAVELLEWDEAMANCNYEVSSPIDCAGGKERSMNFDLLFSSKGEARMSSILSCTKWGIVAISGNRAHGFVSDIKSCSKVGSMYL